MAYYVAILNMLNNPMNDPNVITQLILAENEDDAIYQLIDSSDISNIEQIINMVYFHGSELTCYSKFQKIYNKDVEKHKSERMTLIRESRSEIYTLMTSIKETYFRIDKKEIM
ncbi:MAG: hypothetical protein E6R13_09175 [Spirochaetes bacterium]|nr:MAG: hypothetical protein E6R13_09175 [Spirochaetota bacterium]